ncbi:benzaldehyde dehydrogenase [Amycolatopsis rubida]|uniref:Benzaldehyde dehydrogenase n=1 Tax=Amycolatopsis rubida TaxID=112413 RepID=A0A1I5TFC7_9PSEU|nr:MULTISPECIES: benzaldehyde dehydrogenase [Amycolatopsis]MYW97906.1 aldehyde dehydrogenase family protein [Amycolatopsis rubida]NEC62892.1 benzaldehyde dehydrogenase [Amycolatopsis rubida]OAP23963.1 Benzaldehyde dehydrogenase [NAD(+)] [Amycolatopsis sp. M39]SFP81762.1 benzaldehyde dehydrogenase (NAD) [Amycolatopsis rubida]
MTVTEAASEAAALLDRPRWEGKIFVDAWTAGEAGTRSVVSPGSGQTLTTIGVSSVNDVRRAAKSASRAQLDWARRTPEDRAAVLRRAGELWQQHAQEVQWWLVREAGSVAPKAWLETSAAAAECFEASALPTHPCGDVLPSNGDRWSFARRRPAGVIGVIAPFNFPLTLSVRSVAPALALGNAVLLKPDPRTAVCGGVAVLRIFEEAGLPPGLLQLVNGGGDIGEAIVTAPEVRVISFTGSTAAGRKVGEAGARHLKRTHLELGGNSALIVLPGADPARAASAGAFGSFLHQGQICMATGRHLVHESLYDDYVAAIAEKATRMTVGDPATETVALGPLIDHTQLAHVASVVDDTVAAGAALAAGGTHNGLFFAPTVLTELTTDMRAWQEEVFGPVAPVMSFSAPEEALDLARSSEYGLSLGILGEVGAAMRLADDIPSGIVHINEQTVADEAHIPFGGIGNSGTGARFGGAAANIDAFTETQWLTARPDIACYPF